MKVNYKLQYMLPCAVLLSCSFPKKIQITCSESTASIVANGKEVGQGNTTIVVPPKGCSTVKVEAVGFLPEEREFCKSKDQWLPNNYHFKLERDKSYDASAKNDLANNDIEIRTSMPEDQAWKLISQIIMNHFDIIEIADKSTGYIRTAWNAERFPKYTVRTRVIVKQSSTDPLGYKVKLISERAQGEEVSVKADEQFRPWDRVLRKYENLQPEIQARLQ